MLRNFAGWKFLPQTDKLCKIKNLSNSNFIQHHATTSHRAKPRKVVFFSLIQFCNFLPSKIKIYATFLFGGWTNSRFLFQKMGSYLRFVPGCILCHDAWVESPEVEFSPTYRLTVGFPLLSHSKTRPKTRSEINNESILILSPFLESCCSQNLPQNDFMVQAYFPTTIYEVHFSPKNMSFQDLLTHLAFRGLQKWYF